MNESTFKVVATTDNFMQEVVEASARQPVLVDFWAPWCGPCKTLMPMLDRIADDYAGRFRLAKLNTDENQQLAGQFGIRSIPTAMLFKDGQVVDQFIGVQPEAEIRAMLDKHVGSDTSGVEAPAVRPLDQARELSARGQTSEALELIDAALTEAPEDTALLGERATILLLERDTSGARETLDRIATLDADFGLLRPLRAQLAFTESAVAHPDAGALRRALEADPKDHVARNALAAHHALAGDFATALSEWLDLMRRDRSFGDDIARKSMTMVFDLLGENDELVSSYRRKMASLLH